LNISLNIIIDRLSEYNCEYFLTVPSDREVCAVKLLTGPKAETDSGSLYVSSLSTALSSGRDKESPAIFICPVGSTAAERINAEGRKDLIIVRNDISIEELASFIQDVFNEFNTWYQNMMEAIIKNQSFQKLIDLSEGILKNYVQITDSSFKLLGFTRNIECDEEVTVLARKYGFHPESTIKKFEKYHRFEVWEKSADILINDERNICRYTIVSKVFRFSNTYFAHAAMVCNNVPLSGGLIEVYKLFTDLIGVYVEKEWETAREYHPVYDAFLTDLYYGTLTNREIVEERARHVGVPVKGCFYLSLISGIEGGRYSPEMIAKEFSLYRQNDKVVVADGRITILSIFDSKHSGSQLETLRSDLGAMMEKYDLRCGISSAFRDLMAAPKAMEQARKALSCSGRTPGAKLLPELDGALNGLEKRVVSFEESFYYILLGALPANRDIWEHSIYYDTLKMLDDYDKKHGMNNLHLLYTYLSCESRLAETGARLHMSRNNVAYRIERIELMTGMDLKVTSVRVGLMISYIMLQLYGFD